MTTLAPPSSTKASTLAFALAFLPKARRDDALVFYRFCRTVDDIADSPDLPPSEKREQLDEWLAAVEECSLPRELETLVQRYEVDRTLLAEIIRGCATDIESVRFSDLPALEKYCWRVACAVGLVSVRIFGCEGESADVYAEQLGHALQLTNILRDVAEDASMGRIYLPLDDLEKFGVTEAELLRGQPGPGFLPLMRCQATRARTRFAAATPPLAQWHHLRSPEIMRAFYEKILARLEAANFPVFEKRIRLGRVEKLSTALATLLQPRKKSPPR